jgi:hypothetical protein
MFGVRFNSSTCSLNCPLEITTSTLIGPISASPSKLQHFPREALIGRRPLRGTS